MTGQPRAFVSHSHSDKAVAQSIAEALRANGIDAWFDAWEISPGDSLVQKIFEEGLRDCKVFVVLLSPASVGSDWVRNELDAAVVQRIEGVTRVVPVVVSKCDIPTSLRALLRLDLTVESLETVVARLVDVVFGRDRKPSIGPPPSQLNFNVPGLTNNAARVALLLSGSMDRPDGVPQAYSGETIADQLKLSAEQVNDAVDELEASGYAATLSWIGTHPFDFGQVEPTPALAFAMRGTGAIEYDPEDDVRVVAAAVGQAKQIDGSGLHEATNLSPSRINRAVSFLEQRGLVRVLRYLGTMPFDFGEVHATASLRRYLSQHQS